MKEFQKAELEVIQFSEDVVTASCQEVHCVSDVCMCNVNAVCVCDTQVTGA